MPHVSEVSKLKHRIEVELTRMTLNGDLAKDASAIINRIITPDSPRYRCCRYKERAILAYRMKLVLNGDPGMELQEAADHALAGKLSEQDEYVIRVIPEACDQCPIDKFLVTNACRNCLAHECVDNCPRHAISIIDNHSHIDSSKCVECGMCKKSCPYGAIIEVSRPCENACKLKVIHAGPDRYATIDYNKCVQCGSCNVACPFGAIEEKTSIVQILSGIMNKRKEYYAMLAPSFVGQFGPLIKTGQIVSGLKKLGFAGAFETAFGADIVTAAEGDEFAKNIPAVKKFMTTSCCPAFVSMVRKYMAESRDHVSSVVSPMVAMAMYMKRLKPDAGVVFIGPCSAKKVEARKYPEFIDYVLTFKELGCMFEGAGIDLKSEPEAEFTALASQRGNAFAAAGGVAEAVRAYLAAVHPEAAGRLKVEAASGLADCRNILTMIEQGKLEANLIEGMACVGGCVGGPGALIDKQVAVALAKKHNASVASLSAADVQAARDEAAGNARLHDAANLRAAKVTQSAAPTQVAD